MQVYSLSAALGEGDDHVCLDSPAFVPAVPAFAPFLAPVLVADRKVMVITQPTNQYASCLTIQRGQFHTDRARHPKGSKASLGPAEDLVKR